MVQWHVQLRLDLSGARAARSDRYFELRYEDLVADDRGSLGRGHAPTSSASNPIPGRGGLLREPSMRAADAVPGPDSVILSRRTTAVFGSPKCLRSQGTSPRPGFDQPKSHMVRLRKRQIPLHDYASGSPRQRQGTDSSAQRRCRPRAES